ncbi:MAG: hypothetical protein CMG55_10680 [Candidatus Marinimicrobia bacterium]|nr:hypothetical protein [Candidatus Neomarinimicrobiota bacterium]|tara:strand:+ start:2477 stop:2962 length:486 start_codon:yes stop_codon:yes gene_type:complete
MSEQEYTLEEISYSKKEDCRIMEAVLNSWFKDPKSLNLVSPNLPYPFKFKQWISKYYTNNKKTITTKILKQNNWIVGHLSIRIEKNNLYIYHLFIDPKHRKKGLAKKILVEVNQIGLMLKKSTISLNVVKTNFIAVKIYLNMGYEKVVPTKKKNIKMIKYL